MRSKISCFNMTLFLKNLTRFWPFAVIYALIEILSHPVVLYLRMDTSKWVNSQSARLDFVRGYFREIYFFDAMVIFIVAMILAMAVCSYLYQSRSAYSMHAFPVTRTELFLSNYLAGLVLMILPQFLTALITNLVLLGSVNSMIPLVWKWFGTLIVYSVFFYSFACFVSMFTGQLLAAPLFYLIWNFLYYAVVGLIDGVASVFVYGLGDALIDMGYTPLSPLLYLMQHVRLVDNKGNFAGSSILLAAVLVGLVFTAAAWFVYQERNIEGAGEFITVAWAKPLFRWSVSVMGAMAGALFMVYVISDSRYEQNASALIGKFLIYMILFGAAFFIVAEMFIEKSFKVFRKKVFIEGASCVAVLLVLCGMLQFDIFGLETYVPETENVRVARVSGSSSTVWVSTEDIDKIKDLHESLLAYRRQLKKNHIDYTSDKYRSFSFDYYMKDGSRVSRYYCISEQMLGTPELAALVEAYDALTLDPEANKRSYFGVKYEEMDWQVRDASLNYSKIVDSEMQSLEPISTVESCNVTIMDTKEKMQKLYQAVLSDMEEGNLRYSYGENDDLDELEAELYLHMVSPVSMDEVDDYNMIGCIYTDDSITYCDAYIRLTKQSTHVIDTLIELGVIDSADQLL